MAQEVTAGNVAAVQKTLEKEILAALQRVGLQTYELESIALKPKADKTVSGLLPGCELKCKLVGFPPKLECEVVCG
ncbi:hypothetical protein ARD30_03580 [Bosea thiooxidans]|uniref:Uncharacterized protein n=1 Tax=Bosea thiooxidans TaxID=53254 RepID=A0A0Q3I9I6_9HYPH|nr:hypothetical protein [Bosea thiooxidans]KQK31493.1 hypothetical protein ARD30_03580 [Bosea thiooxidans]SKB78935.1 hypothetical protein SAMN05660750_02365 [Bosea thiooxidans]